MLTTIFGCFDPKQCLTECVDALNDLFSELNKKMIISQDVTMC